MSGMLLAAWRYRHFILNSIKNEFVSRFVRSRLGGLWIVIHPLAQVAIFAFVLSTVLSAKLPGIDNRYAYALYLMAGMLAWNLFAEVISRSMNVFLENGNLLKKMVFPRISLPLIVSGSALVNNLLLLAAILFVFALLGHVPGVTVLWLPLLILLNLAFSVGLGLTLGVLNVFLRDISQIVPIILQFGFWLTPIVYVKSALPEEYQALIDLNPLVPLVESYQHVLIFNETPSMGPLMGTTVAALVLLLLALFLFRKANAEMVDML